MSHADVMGRQPERRVFASTATIRTRHHGIAAMTARSMSCLRILCMTSKITSGLLSPTKGVANCALASPIGPGL
jgi:hypothetical protein